MGILRKFAPYLRKLLQAKQERRRKNAVATRTSRAMDIYSSNSTKFRTVEKLSWEEIEKATDNFRCVIGEGGFSTVYTAVLEDQTLCAIKVQRKSERLRQIFSQELNALLRARNVNLVNLIAYCDEREEGVLVLEYVPNGNLHDTLQAETSNIILPWPRRVAIAVQIASALEYLHEVCDPPIVHADVKSSNILLDDKYNGKLCDFGFSKTGNKSYPSRNCSLMGSPGYIDPHCLRSGIVSKKIDVYSFGVLLLELVTGMEAFCGENREILALFASPYLKDPKKLCEIVDSRLDGCFDRKEAEAIAFMAAQCLHGEPELRPSMSEIVRLMNEKLRILESSLTHYMKLQNTRVLELKPV